MCTCHFAKLETWQCACRNPSLGLATEARACKVAGQEGTPRGTLQLLGVPKSVREWTLTFSSELPCWELESQWTLESSECDYKGQNPLAWRVIYIIRKLSKLRCLKWARIAHLDIWNTSYDQKKGRGSNWQFDSRPLKVKNWPNFLACSWCATYRWKALDKGYNFALDFIVIRSLHVKLWGLKISGVLDVGISRLPLGSPRQNAIWM
jgi:hypothetical protein